MKIRGKTRMMGIRLSKRLKVLFVSTSNFSLFNLYPFFISVGTFHQSCSVDLTAKLLQVYLCG